MQDKRPAKSKAKNQLKLQDDRIKQYCKQNQTYSSMLYQMIQMGLKSTNSSHDTSNAKSCSEVYKVLARFNQALGREVSAIQQDTADQRRAVEQILNFMRSAQFIESEQLIDENQAIPFFLNSLEQKENTKAYLQNSIAKMQQEGKQAQYEMDLQIKNNQMKQMILQKQSKTVSLKNKLEKLLQQNKKCVKKYHDLKASMIADEIKLRQIEVSQNKLKKK